MSDGNERTAISIAARENIMCTYGGARPACLPENKLGAIFERFYSERPKHEAYGRHSGLGLSIAHQIVMAHNGKIWAENRENNGDAVTGARFTVELDRA